MIVPQRKLLLFLILVVLAASLPYLNSVSGEFVWDDTVLIRDNRYLHEWKYLPKILTESMGAGARDKGVKGDVNSLSRPLPMLTLMLNYAAFKLDPVGYHLTNILIHVLTSLALYWLVSLISPKTLLALFTALIFASHPIHTEVVAYVSGRDTGLAALLLLVSLSCYLEGGHRPGRGWYPLSLAAFSLALLSKEFAVVGPLLLLAYETIFKRLTRAALLRLAPFLLVDVAWIVAKLTVLSFDAADLRGHRIEFYYRITGFFAAWPAYLRLLVFPSDQHVDYGFVRYDLWKPVVLLGIVLFMAAGILCLRLMRRQRLVSFALAWLILNLAPYAGLYPTNAFMAEHWLTVPAIGFFLLVAAAFTAAAARWPRGGGWIWAAIFLLPLVLGARTAVQNRYWKDGLTFYTRSIRYAPRVNLGEWHFNLGNYHLDRKDYPEAIKAYSRAIELDRKDEAPHINIGVIELRGGRYPEAEASFRRALSINPRSAPAYKNLATLAVRQGNYRAAIAHLETAARLSPEDPVIRERIRELQSMLQPASPG